MYWTVQSNAAPANTDATFTVNGVSGQRTYIHSVLASYSAAPAGGRLTIRGKRSDRVIDLDITAAGATPLAIDPNGIPFDVGEDVELRLFAAGAAVVGKINAVVRRQSINE